MEIRETRYSGYFVTEDGRVFSSKKSGLLHEVRGVIDDKGYRKTMILVGRQRKNVMFHRLVAETFLGETSLPAINHKDGNKLNNHPSNLEYCTIAENNQHAHATGLCPRGEKLKSAKLKDRDCVRIISLYNEGAKAKDLAKRFNTSEGLIRDILAGRRRKWIQEESLIRKTRSKVKYSDAEMAEIIEEILSGIEAHTVAEKYDIKPMYLFQILRKERRQKVWEIIGNPNTVPTSKMPVEKCADMIREALAGVPRKTLQEEYGISKAQLSKVLRKDFREDEWKLVEGSETIP